MAWPGFAADAIAVKTASARPGVVRQTIAAHGVLVADATQQAAFPAPRPGQVSRILVRPGEDVAAGALLLTLAPSPLERQAFQQAQTSAALAQRDLAQARARRAMGQASLAEITSAERNFELAESDFLARQGRFVFNHGEDEVRAPYAARIVGLPAYQGLAVQAGTTLALLAPQSALIARLDVAPADRKRVRPGAFAVVYPVAMGGNRVATRVDAIDIPTDAGVGGRIAVRLRDAQATGFAVGMHVAGTIAVEERQGLVVPYGAVQRDARGDYVLLLQDDRARRTGVRTGLTDGEQTVVEVGLAAGDIVILPEGLPVKDGTRVRIAPPDAK